jgi:hypothetical protein
MTKLAKAQGKVDMFSRKEEIVDGIMKKLKPSYRTKWIRKQLMRNNKEKLLKHLSIYD